jgi:hypothetical protein
MTVPPRMQVGFIGTGAVSRSLARAVAEVGLPRARREAGRAAEAPRPAGVSSPCPMPGLTASYFGPQVRPAGFTARAYAFAPPPPLPPPPLCPRRPRP